jgi:L-ascorbate metabolism protein UlaG (beta-lactamase superfamily)
MPLAAWILLIPAAALLFIISFIIGGWLLSAPRYKGPLSDHFDGKKFNNPGNVQPQGLGNVLKWLLNRKKEKWEKISPPPGPPPPDRVSEGELRITFINHCTFLIQVDGMNILTDPVWSERASPFSWAGPRRMRPPGIRMEDLPKIDVLLISHNHYDHLDIASVKKIVAAHQPKIFVPLGVKAYLEKKGITNIKEMDWGDELPLDEKLKLACVPAQHFSGRGMFDRDATLWCGFVICSKHGNIYFAADTGYNKVLKEAGKKYSPIRAALLPIGAYRPEWFMGVVHATPAESVQVHIEIGSHQSIGSHFGTFPLADEGMYDPAKDLHAALSALNIPAADFIVPEEGKGIDVKAL